MKLNLKALSLSTGILWGVSLLITTLISIPTGYAKAGLDVIASLYPGYTISVLGSFIGLIYGFIDGAISLLIFGWLYNKISG